MPLVVDFKWVSGVRCQDHEAYENYQILRVFFADT